MRRARNKKQKIKKDKVKRTNKSQRGYWCVVKFYYNWDQLLQFTKWKVDSAVIIEFNCAIFAGSYW